MKQFTCSQCGSLNIRLSMDINPNESVDIQTLSIGTVVDGLLANCYSCKEEVEVIMTEHWVPLK